MTGISTLIGCVLVAATAWAETLPSYQPVSPNIGIVVTRKGKPAAGVLVTFNVDSRLKDTLYWSGSTDAVGRILSPKLSPGKYLVFADAGKRDSTVYIEVIGEGGERSELKMKLTVPGVGDAEDAPVAVRIRDFQGIVLDRTGTALPQSEIEVLRQDNLDAGPFLKIQTDATGHFSAHLDKGIYVAISYCRGFKSSVTVFEITEKGDAELRIALEVGSNA